HPLIDGGNGFGAALFPKPARSGATTQYRSLKNGAANCQFDQAFAPGPEPCTNRIASFAPFPAALTNVRWLPCCMTSCWISDIAYLDQRFGAAVLVPCARNVSKYRLPS